MIFILLTTALLQFIVIYLLVENGKAIDDLQEALNDAILAEGNDKIKFVPIHKGIMVKEG